MSGTTVNEIPDLSALLNTCTQEHTGLHFYYDKIKLWSIGRPLSETTNRFVPFDHLRTVPYTMDLGGRHHQWPFELLNYLEDIFWERSCFWMKYSIGSRVIDSLQPTVHVIFLTKPSIEMILLNQMPVEFTWFSLCCPSLRLLDSQEEEGWFYLILGPHPNPRFSY